MGEDKRWQFWIDRGGTFTDVVALRPDGQLITHKLLSDNLLNFDNLLHCLIFTATGRQIIELGTSLKLTENHTNQTKQYRVTDKTI